MADGLNKVMLLGYLGQDPELKTIAGGQAVLNLRLATTDSYLDKSNTRQERTDWHTCVIWGKRAEALAKFLKKGAQVYVEGRLQTRSYEKNGEKRYSTDIQVSNVIVCGSGRGESSSDTDRRQSSPPKAAPADDGFGSGSTSDADEIPF